MVNVSAEKSGLPMIAAMTGVMRSATSAVTTAPKAAPITIPTARSTTLPRSRNCLKSFMSPGLPFVLVAALAGRLGLHRTEAAILVSKSRRRRPPGADSARGQDLDGRQAAGLGRRDAARPNPRAALRERGVRRGPRLRRLNPPRDP